PSPDCEMHGVEAAHHTGNDDGDPLRRRTAFCLHLMKRFSLGLSRGTTGQRREAVTQRFDAHEAAQLTDMVDGVGISHIVDEVSLAAARADQRLEMLVTREPALQCAAMHSHRRRSGSYWHTGGDHSSGSNEDVTASLIRPPRTSASLPWFGVPPGPSAARSPLPGDDRSVPPPREVAGSPAGGEPPPGEVVSRTPAGEAVPSACLAALPEVPAGPDPLRSGSDCAMALAGELPRSPP